MNNFTSGTKATGPVTEPYLVRIAQADASYFEQHLQTNQTEFLKMSIDFDGTIMYSLQMTSEQELSIRLSFPLRGLLKFRSLPDIYTT